MTMINSSPDSSTQVSTTLALTLSPTPRKLTIATRVMNASAISDQAVAEIEVEGFAQIRANAREAVHAEVMPEDITVNATMNVTKWTPNALW